jgi:hypothetical protein
MRTSPVLDRLFIAGTIVNLALADKVLTTSSAPMQALPASRSYIEKMPSPEQTAAPSSVPWHDVEELLHEIGELAKSRPSIDEFAETVCRQARQTLSAEAMAIWLRESQGEWQLAAESMTSPLDVRRVRPGATTGEQKSLVAPFAIGAGRDGAIELLLAETPHSRAPRLLSLHRPGPPGLWPLRQTA